MNSIVSHYLVCKECGIIDQDLSRVQQGIPCFSCGQPSRGGLLYYGMPTRTLVQLVQKMSESQPEKIVDDPGPGIATVIFFCTLTESLLEKLLLNLMTALRIARSDRQRLLDENPYISQRSKKLFRSLSETKWKDAVKEISDSITPAFNDVHELCLKAIKARNSFLHGGNAWVMPDDLPEDCARYTIPLLDFFAAMHNKFVAKHYAGDRKYDTLN